MIPMCSIPVQVVWKLNVMYVNLVVGWQQLTGDAHGKTAQFYTIFAGLSLFRTVCCAP